MVTGRTTEPRGSVTVSRTSGSAAVTASAGTFSSEDVGRTVTGTGIPANTTIAAVASGTAATLSANATTTTNGAVALGQAQDASTGYRGWSPESTAEAASYTVAANNAGTVPPDRISNPTTNVSGHTRRARD